MDGFALSYDQGVVETADCRLIELAADGNHEHAASVADRNSGSCGRSHVAILMLYRQGGQGDPSEAVRASRGAVLS